MNAIKLLAETAQDIVSKTYVAGYQDRVPTNAAHYPIDARRRCNCGQFCTALGADGGMVLGLGAVRRRIVLFIRTQPQRRPSASNRSSIGRIYWVLSGQFSYNSDAPDGDGRTLWRLMS
jgi:hypothetical protein